MRANMGFTINERKENKGLKGKMENKDKAKKKISDLLNTIDEMMYPSEIAEQLHIDYNLCVEIIEELWKEGRIEIVEDSETGDDKKWIKN